MRSFAPLPVFIVLVLADDPDDFLRLIFLPPAVYLEDAHRLSGLGEHFEHSVLKVEAVVFVSEAGEIVP
jgi:hypothetical protein